MFAVNGSKFYPNHIQKKEETIDYLTPGIYKFDVEGSVFFQRPVFEAEAFREGLIDLKGYPFDGIKRRLSSFFNEATREIYKDTQIRHFIGCMLHGPPGTGKTCFIDTICQKFAHTHEAVTLRLTDSENINNLSRIVNLIRSNNPDKMVIILLEELDKIMHRGNVHHTTIEKYLIDFCDGQDTPSNVLMIASTNHIDKIPTSLKNRPSRFNITEEINTIPTEIASQLIAKLVPSKYNGKINVSELAYKVTETGISIDQVKYVVLNILCDGRTVEEAISIVTNKPGLAPAAKEDEDEEEEEED